MLSHLVGAANRADIRRLQALEAQTAALEERLQRQQAQLHEAIVARDAAIAASQQALARAVIAPAASEPEAETAAARLAHLERQLAADQGRRARLEAQLAGAQAEATAARADAQALESRELLLRHEIDAIEHDLAARFAPAAGLQPDLHGLTLLYVGGRPSQIVHLRQVAGRLGTVLVHHDGGIEEKTDLLPGLVSRADRVMFPVDCVSHEAAGLTKRTCRTLGKTYVPLRTTGIAAFLAGLRRPAAAPAG